jgi:uncharacterized protein
MLTATLVLGVATFVAGLAAWDLKINFLNFIALPITFGIGVDYAVNTFSRYLHERRSAGASDAALRTIASTGGAVALCSLTTIIGYGSLLAARSGALISFGRVAILGEVTTLAAAVVFLPAWLAAWTRSPSSNARAVTSPAGCSGRAQ